MDLRDFRALRTTSDPRGFTCFIRFCRLPLQPGPPARCWPSRLCGLPEADPVQNQASGSSQHFQTRIPHHSEGQSVWPPKALAKGPKRCRSEMCWINSTWNRLRSMGNKRREGNLQIQFHPSFHPTAPRDS